MALGFSGLGKMTLSLSTSSLVIGAPVGGTPPPADTTAPTFTSASVFSIAENQPLSIEITTSEPATITKAGGADAALWTLSGSTLSLGAKDFEVPTDGNLDNVYEVQLRAVDAAGNPQMVTISATVTNVLEGVRAALTPAVLTIASGTAAGTLLADYAALVEGESRAVDANWLAFNTAGDLLVGVGNLPAGGSYRPKITTKRAGEPDIVTELDVTISAGQSRLPLNTPLVLIGNSKNADSFAYSMMGYVEGVTGGRYYAGPWSRQAKGGDWVMDYVQRLPAALAAAGNKGVLWLGDATNDVGKKYPVGSQTSRTPAQILADYRTLAEQWFAGGGQRLVIETTARITSWAAGGTSDVDRQAVNSGLVSMSQEAAFAGKIGLADLTGLDLSSTALSRDGTHYTAKGALAASQIVGAVLLGWIVTDSIFPASGAIAAGGGFGANQIDNYALADVSPANGTPDNFTTQNLSGATMTPTMITEDGKAKVKLAFTGAATGAGLDRIYRQITIPGGAPAGSCWETIVEYEISNAAGAGDPAGLAALSGKAAQGTQFGETIQTSAGVLPKHKGVMRIASPPISVGSGTSTAASLSSEFVTRSAVGVAEDAVAKLSAPWFFRQCEMTAYAAPYNQAIAYTEPSDSETFSLFTGPVVSRATNMLNVTAGNVSGGALAIAYQWRKDGAAIAGATNRFHDSGGVAGFYECALTYTNSFGSLTLISTGITNP